MSYLWILWTRNCGHFGWPVNTHTLESNPGRVRYRTRIDEGQPELWKDAPLLSLDRSSQLANGLDDASRV